MFHASDSANMVSLPTTNTCTVNKHRLLTALYNDYKASTMKITLIFVWHSLDPDVVFSLTPRLSIVWVCDKHDGYNN